LLFLYCSLANRAPVISCHISGLARTSWLSSHTVILLLGLCLHSRILVDMDHPASALTHVASGVQFKRPKKKAVRLAKVKSQRFPSNITSEEGEDRRLSLRRCLRALQIQTLQQLCALLTQEEHHFAREDVDRSGRNILRVHMSGTKNSRRFIHVYLWWALLLGPNYPISDRLLQGNVWKSLRCVCGMGIVDTRGHRRSVSSVCINPRHYRMESCIDIASILREDILHMREEAKDGAWLEHSGPEVHAFVSAVVARAEASTGAEHFKPLVELIRTTCEPPVFALCSPNLILDNIPSFARFLHARERISFFRPTHRTATIFGVFLANYFHSVKYRV
jgi:hypothetical protein